MRTYYLIIVREHKRWRQKCLCESHKSLLLHKCNKKLKNLALQTRMATHVEILMTNELFESRKTGEVHTSFYEVSC